MDKAKKLAEPVQLLIRKGYLWPSGELGIVKFMLGESVIELTISQARTMADQILKRTEAAHA